MLEGLGSILTLVEGCDKLQCVDELRVEAAGHLNSHASWEEKKIEDSQVWLLVPWDLVFVHNASQDWVRSPVFESEDAHGCRCSVISSKAKNFTEAHA